MATGGSISLPNIDKQFEQFSKFGDSKSDGKTINLKNSDKWMKQAKLFNKTFTTTDTGIAFAKFKSKTLDKKQFLEYIEDLCKSKKMDVTNFTKSLNECGKPGTTGTTKVADMNVTDRLTDTSKYTGAHKERFDESGKGKGIEGREDTTAQDGYVQGYKEKNKYDKSH